MSTYNLNPERLAELLRRYPHESNAALAADFGLSAAAVGNVGSTHGVKKTPAALSQVHSTGDSVAAEVVKAAQALGARGISRPEAIAALPQFAAGSVCAALRLEAQRGRLHQAGRCRYFRWFAEQAHALAHNAAMFGSALARAPAPNERGPARTDAAPVVTAATRITECPPTGWRAQAAAPVDGLFRSLQPGRYLDAEAKPWINAATTKGQQP